jgi:hypothetical protein
MPVKYWSFAGLMLTDWCNARCASCYGCCGPERNDWMPRETAIRVWRELAEASPHGCRIHLAGGEPFGDWQRLIGIARAAAHAGLGPLESVETNAFWATSDEVARRRVQALDAAGMGRLVISADPYHQQFVPIENCRRLARVARELLGPGRLRVRWEDWLEEGFDLARADERMRGGVFDAWAREGRDRLCGRAAAEIAPRAQIKPVEELADSPCRDALLRSRHVHVGPDGKLMPGTCAGIVLGDAARAGIAEIWRRLGADHASRPIVGRLADRGPTGLLDDAVAGGYVVRDGYGSKCHLCWELRRHLARAGRFGDELGPPWMYGEAARTADGR